MKKIRLIALAAVLFVVSSCLDDGVTKYHILNIDPEYIFLKVGETKDISVTYNYYDSEDPDHTVSIDDFKFVLSDDKVASIEIVTEEVEYQGQTFTVNVPRVTGLAEGSAVMLVTVDETSDYAYITVLPAAEEETEDDTAEE